MILAGTATVAAAAGGGYLALRRNAEESARIGLAADPAMPAAQTSAPQPAAAPQPAPEAIPAAPPTRVADRPATAPRPTNLSKSSPSAKVSEPAAVTSAPATAPAAPTESAVPESRDARNDAAGVGADPSLPRVETLTIAPDAVIGIRLDSTISSETARVEDRVTARVTRDVIVDGRTAISAGARLEGVVTTVDQGGKFKDRSRVGVRFQSIVLADSARLPIQTETIFRDGESPAAPAAQKVGASAALGGLLGAVIGGKKGAAIGATVGAAGGSAAVMAGAAPNAILQAGTPLTVRLTAPVTVEIEKEDHDIRN